MKAIKVWDITAPTDNWGRGYARLAWLAVGINRALSTKIEVKNG